MPHKLLLADDSVTIQRVIELTFADEDVEVIAVGDGQKAIERIEADRPDIVLADVGMPERDGYQVAAFVKSTPHLAHIPVLLLTGAFEPVDEQRAGAVGCDGVLAKPFEPHMVITRVKELLSGAGAALRAPTAAQEFQAPAEERTAPRAALPAESETGPAADVSAVPATVPAASAPEAAPPPGAEPVDAALRLSRRTPIAVPGFGAPAPPAEGHAALDEYFDRLDAAFATLHQAQPEAAEALPARADEAAAGAPPAAEPEPGPAHGAASSSPSQPVPSAPTPAAASAPKVPAQAVGIAQAFSALFAAERGESSPDVPAFIGPAAAPQVSVDDLAERVTRQVLERLSDRVVRDTVADIVSRVAERLIRDEIERVKATLK